MKVKPTLHRLVGSRNLLDIVAVDMNDALDQYDKMREDIVLNVSYMAHNVLDRWARPTYGTAYDIDNYGFTQPCFIRTKL